MWVQAFQVVCHWFAVKKQARKRKEYWWENGLGCKGSRLRATSYKDGKACVYAHVCLLSPSVACCLAPCPVPGLIFRLSPISIITPTPHFPVPAFPSKTELQGVTVKISPYEMQQNIQDPHRSSLVVGWVYVKRPDRTFPVRSLQLWWIWILNAIYHLFNGDRKVWSPVIHP